MSQHRLVELETAAGPLKTVLLEWEASAGRSGPAVLAEQKALRPDAFLAVEWRDVRAVSGRDAWTRYLWGGAPVRAAADAMMEAAAAARKNAPLPAGKARSKRPGGRAAASPAGDPGPLFKPS